MSYHTPVLLQAVCDALEVQPGNKYIDATLGGGGHSHEIILRGGKVLGIDQDSDAISACLALYPKEVQGGALVPVLSNFTHIKELVQKNNWQPVSGILADLGISSYQIDTPARGFSIQRPGPLDMRMDKSLPNTAATLVNLLSEADLARLFVNYGEVPGSKALAKKIISRRPFATTEELAQVVGIHARQVFQALRIAVNDELNSLEIFLDDSLTLLEPGGKLVVISFHSLEDRIIKQKFLSWSNSGLVEISDTKPIVATAEELQTNSRAKSAKLRICKKL